MQCACLQKGVFNAFSWYFRVFSRIAFEISSTFGIVRFPGILAGLAANCSFYFTGELRSWGLFREGI